MTLTKDQRHYRKKQKQSKKDFRRATSCNGNPAIHANKKKLCVRISELAHRYLKRRAEYEGRSVSKVLENMLVNILPDYNQNGSAASFTTKRYCWRKCVKSALKRKRGGSYQVNLWVVSTAWHKLDIASAHTNCSKARIVEMMIREKIK